MSCESRPQLRMCAQTAQSIIHASIGLSKLSSTHRSFTTCIGRLFSRMSSRHLSWHLLRSLLKSIAKLESRALRLMLPEDAPVGIIDPSEVGVIAAYLLAQDDTSVHNHAKYVLNGPEDINGKQIVDMIEQHIGAPVKDVSYKDVSFIAMLYEYQYAATKQSKNVIYSISGPLRRHGKGSARFLQLARRF